MLGVIRPAQFVSICSLPFLFLSGKTWHLEHITFRYLKRDIWYVNSHGRFFEFVVICQRQETGWSLQRVSLTLVFSPFAHFRMETLLFFTTSTVSWAHYYVLKSSPCIESWTDVKDSSSCIQLWTRVRLDCRIWVSDFQTSAASPAKTVRNCLTLLLWVLSFLRLFSGIRNILFPFQTTTQ